MKCFFVRVFVSSFRTFWRLRHFSLTTTTTTTVTATKTLFFIFFGLRAASFPSLLSEAFLRLEEPCQNQFEIICFGEKKLLQTFLTLFSFCFLIINIFTPKNGRKKGIFLQPAISLNCKQSNSVLTTTVKTHSWLQQIFRSQMAILHH